MATAPKKSLKIWAPKDNSRVKKILITAKYAGVELDFAVFTFGETNKTPEFLRANPNGKVPVLEVPGEGFIFESNSIVRYVAGLNESKGLLGNTAIQKAQVDSWVQWAATELDPYVGGWIYPILGYAPFSQDVLTLSQDRLRKALESLNRHLEVKTFLVGERQTIGDIVVAATLFPLYQRVLDPSWRAKISNVNRWFELITLKENFASIWRLEQSAWCTVAQKAPIAKKEEAKKEKAEEVQDAPAGEAKKEEKKEEKKADKKKKKDDDEEEEDDAPKEEKKKNPLDDLPKSTFVLDDYKRSFSNHSVDDSTEWLEKNFDPAGYSMWYCKYKYNNDLSKIFMSTNLIGGFFQRMDRMRKYSFGCVSIYGEDGAGNHDISGFWIIRSNEVPQYMRDECDDVDLYEWTKIPFENFEAEKSKIKAYLNGDALDGKPYADGKCFK